MARQPQDPTRQVTFQVSTAQRPDFKHPLVVYVFDARGQLLEQVAVRDGKVQLSIPKAGLGRERVFVAPVSEKINAKRLTPALMERLGAYQPVLQAGGELTDHIDIPGSIIDIWPFCFCWVHGRTVRKSDNRAVCNARVHICEVDRIPWWIERLPDADVFVFATICCVSFSSRQFQALGRIRGLSCKVPLAPKTRCSGSLKTSVL
jgi:hypothetical protein